MAGDVTRAVGIVEQAYYDLHILPPLKTSLVRAQRRVRKRTLNMLRSIIIGLGSAERTNSLEKHASPRSVRSLVIGGPPRAYFFFAILRNGLAQVLKK